jgi:signal transduction histidine kinase/tetratricopeptide (TPR) repeat protein
MTMRAWLSPSRRLLALFFAVTLAPAAGLVWLGWRLLEQDRQLEAQRAMERREYAADRIVAALRQEVSDTLRLLSDPGRLPELTAEGSVVVSLQPARLTVQPHSGVLYYPVVPPEPEVPGGPFLEAEKLEFQKKDYARAIEALRKLEGSKDDAVRAGALLRLARNYRKTGDEEGALAAYERLAHIDGVRIDGVPAALRARCARCALLEKLGRTESLRKEAGALAEGLFNGRWRITAPVFQLHAGQVRAWLNDSEIAEGDRVALSAAVDWLWRKWRAAQSGGTALQESMVYLAEGHAFTMLANDSGERAEVLVAGSEFARSRWLKPVTPIMESQGVQLRLRDSGGNSLLGKAPASPNLESLRFPADTALPWTVAVSSRNAAADTVQFGTRRRLLFSGLALVMVLVLASSYYIARGISRELAAARLKSDFVSAVSHEFRTPLATMRHLTEILADGRVASEERRISYYGAQLRATGRLSRLVERLLDFGRMEAGAFRYRLAAVDLGELLQSVVEEFEQVVADTGHRIDLMVDPELPPVFADREALAQAVWNLLDNAVKYSPGRPEVWVEAARQDGRVAIRIRDEGLGFPAEEHKNLFGKFVRGSAARAAGVKGTGIGLAMVDYIVRSHKGRILVDSIPGKGSSFTILLNTEET